MLDISTMPSRQRPKPRKRLPSAILGKLSELLYTNQNRKPEDLRFNLILLQKDGLFIIYFCYFVYFDTNII